MAYIPQHYERIEEAAAEREAMVVTKTAQISAKLQELFKLGLTGADVRMPYSTINKYGKPVERFEDFRTVLDWCLLSDDVMKLLQLACQCEFPENRLRYLAQFEAAAAKCYADSYAADLAEIEVDADIQDMIDNGSEW